MRKTSGQTKKLLAHTLVELMKDEYLDKIKITSLTKACGINRQTFYYHFNDMYELVYWMLNDQSELILSQIQDPSDIIQIFETFKNYIEENGKTVQDVYYSLSREVLQRFLLDKVREILRKYINLQPYSLHVDPQVIEKVIQFYKHAYVGFILEWIRCGMEKDGLPSDKIAILLGDAIKHGILGIEEIVKSKNQ